MSVQGVSSAVAQRIIVKFLTTENVKPAEILMRLREQFGDETLSRTQVYDWSKSFKEGRTEVGNMPHVRRPRTSVNQANTEKIDGLIRDNRRITVRELAEIVRISVGSVETIIHGELNFTKFIARWVPKLLSDEEKKRRVQISAQLLDRYEREGDPFLHSIVTCDETWVHYFTSTPETKRTSMERRRIDSPPLKKAKTTPFAGKVMASVFWDSQGVLFIDFLTEQRTINAAYYSKLLKDRVKPAFHSKRRGRSVKSVCLLHDNTRPHTAAVTTRTVEEMHWEVLPHPAYSPDLAPSDFHLFGPLKEALGRKKFRADEEVKLFVQQWLDEQPQAFFERGIMKLPLRWRRCIEAKGEYVEK
jgi:histone-lysine N-methyltransferase SETMAR